MRGKGVIGTGHAGKDNAPGIRGIVLFAEAFVQCHSPSRKLRNFSLRDG